MKVITRPQPKAIPPSETRALIGVVRKANRRQRFFNAALLLGMLAVVVAASLLWNRSERQSEAITQLVGSLSDTCDQTNLGTLPDAVRQDCARAQAGQPPVVVEGVPGVPGAAGATGGSGPSGAPGAPGQSPTCLATPAMCVGADGPPGANGSNGTNGVDGQSPPCLNTPVMCQGSDGQNGANGSDGQPPVSWSTTRADGSIETCQRAETFDPANPRYACSVAAPPGGGLVNP